MDSLDIPRWWIYNPLQNFTFWTQKINQLRKGKSSIQLTSIRWGDETTSIIHPPWNIPSIHQHVNFPRLLGFDRSQVVSCIDFKPPSRWIASRPLRQFNCPGRSTLGRVTAFSLGTSVSAFFLVVVEGGWSRRWAMKNRHRVFCKGILREMK